MLAASPTTLPLFLALSACKGPAVLSGPPPVGPQTQTLLRAVTADESAQESSSGSRSAVGQ